MNATLLLLFGIAWLVFAYFWYGRIIDRRVIHTDPGIDTPSKTEYDGQDYVPTHPMVLFGHHFSSIAGAGPIVGPILALSMFGWLPALLWLLLGAVFMGAVHDYTSLMASVRSRGTSITEIAATAVSPTARTLFAIFAWLLLVLVQAVFADLTARTLVEAPTIVVPTFSVIAIAVLFGYAVYRRGLHLALGTVIALLLLFGAILLGYELPIHASYEFWLVLIVLYAFIAATLPVWALLQPRDYISVYVLIGGMALGLIGMFVAQPDINAPAWLGSFISGSGEPLFPMLFITVACGAVSGFHSIVASGTTAKQLRTEKEGRFVAFGSMLTESVLGILVITMVAGLLVWNGSDPATGFQELLHRSANIVFGAALGNAAAAVGIPVAVGMSFGILMINAFILTTLDTTVRLSRYIVQETLGIRYGGVFSNRYLAAAGGLVIALLLCLNDGYKALWPVFGSSNQLIAALALFVVTAYWAGFKRPRLYTLLPAIFMLVVTEAALVYQVFWLYFPRGQWLLLVISIVLMILGLIVAYESWKSLRLGRTDALVRH